MITLWLCCISRSGRLVGIFFFILRQTCAYYTLWNKRAKIISTRRMSIKVAKINILNYSQQWKNLWNQINMVNGLSIAFPNPQIYIFIWWRCSLFLKALPTVNIQTKQYVGRFFKCHEIVFTDLGFADCHSYTACSNPRYFNASVWETYTCNSPHTQGDMMQTFMHIRCQCKQDMCIENNRTDFLSLIFLLCKYV